MTPRLKRAYKLTSTGSLALDLSGQPYVDRAAMSARAVINTLDVDRESEVIVPTGVRTENYELNPVVMWGHGFEGISFPVAECRHPDGRLALEISENEIVGTSYFTNKVKESEQIFALIESGLCKATSIHVDPIERHVERINGQPVEIISDSDLLEWSWGAIGVNPAAVAKTLSRNRLAGSSISESLRRSLSRVAEKRKVVGRGWTDSLTDEERRRKGMEGYELFKSMSQLKTKIKDCVASMDDETLMQMLQSDDDQLHDQLEGVAKDYLSDEHAEVPFRMSGPGGEHDWRQLIEPSKLRKMLDDEYQRRDAEAKQFENPETDAEARELLAEAERERQAGDEGRAEMIEDQARELLREEKAKCWRSRAKLHHICDSFLQGASS